jgi:hypothetical protein
VVVSGRVAEPQRLEFVIAALRYQKIRQTDVGNLRDFIA